VVRGALNFLFKNFVPSPQAVKEQKEVELLSFLTIVNLLHTRKNDLLVISQKSQKKIKKSRPVSRKKI
jgi:hypothetical protein